MNACKKNSVAVVAAVNHCRCSQPLSLLIIDIDHFKQVNDRYGHLLGDSCLQRVGTTLLSQCRRSADFVARYGGEEFALILPDTDLQGALTFAEGVRTDIANMMLEAGETLHQITASIVVATALPSSLSDFKPLH